MSGSGLFSDQSALKPHLVRGTGGIGGEIGDLRGDVGRTLASMAAITVDEFTNPAAAGADLLRAATAVVAAVVELDAGDLLAPGLAILAAYPRNISFTVAGVTPADAPASADIVGTYRGLPQTETVLLNQAGGLTASTKPFSTIESITFPAGDGTDATVSIGVGTGIGVGEVPKARAGAVSIIREIEVGVLVTTGVLTATGLYTPATAADGTRDYAIYYEYDPLA